ncbi:MAG: hypothetical protein G01um101416_646 [Microgenomates group bacterium Gr01-1014_16]|nr:MAG: hypothetical protein G01um101416_646 [Microgenomates group bacterium Gr01-1014_16]
MGKEEEEGGAADDVMGDINPIEAAEERLEGPEAGGESEGQTEKNQADYTCDLAEAGENGGRGGETAGQGFGDRPEDDGNKTESNN